MVQEKKPFHELILDRMKASVELTSVSSRAEQDLQRFGDILRDAILPKDKRAEIIERIRALLKRLMPIFPAKYLEDLALTLEKESGSEDENMAATEIVEQYCGPFKRPTESAFGGVKDMRLLLCAPVGDGSGDVRVVKELWRGNNFSEEEFKARLGKTGRESRIKKMI